MERQRMIFVILMMLVVGQSEPMAAWYCNATQVEQFIDPAHHNPLDYGVTDVLAVLDNVPARPDAATLLKVSQMSRAVGSRAGIWLVIPWCAGCNCGLNQCEHLSHDLYAGTIRSMMQWRGSSSFRPWVDAAGVEHDAVPCPTWNTWWEFQRQRVEGLARLARPFHNIKGIAIDMELYLDNKCNGKTRAVKYKSACYCEYCKRTPYQRVIAEQLARRIKIAAGGLRFGLINADGDAPIHRGMFAGTQPLTSFVEHWYQRGWQDTDYCTSTGNFGSYQHTWTNNGEWDVRFVIGLDPNRLCFEDFDHRPVDALPGSFDSLDGTMWACSEYADGFWLWWAPHVFKKDGAAFCPDDCCCRPDACTVSVGIEDYFKAIQHRDFAPAGACDYRKLPNGLYEVETIDSDCGVLRRMVAEYPCAPALVAGCSNCDRRMSLGRKSE